PEGVPHLDRDVSTVRMAEPLQLVPKDLEQPWLQVLREKAYSSRLRVGAERRGQEAASKDGEKLPARQHERASTVKGCGRNSAARVASGRAGGQVTAFASRPGHHILDGTRRQVVWDPRSGSRFAPGQASVRSRPAERYTVRVAVAGGVVGDSQSGTGIRPTISRPGSLPGLGLTTTVSAWP